MKVPSAVLSETERRYAERSAARSEVQEKIREGVSPTRIDSPDRVRRRFERLGESASIARAARDAERLVLGRRGPATNEQQFALERILGKSDLIGVSFLTNGVEAARAIARIQIAEPGSSAIAGYGTGFLVSPRLLLTNNHVLESAAIARGSFAEFDFEQASNGEARPSVRFALDPDTFFVTNRELDYTLVAVRETSQGGVALSKYPPLKLISAQGKILLGECVNIIQHPNGEPKQLALRENQIVDRLDNFLHYQTDTAPGSSGSPVFNDQWEVVALHHSGVPKRDDQGRLLAIGGALWTESMGEHRIWWKANEGARISQIVADLRTRPLSGAQAALRSSVIGQEAAGPSGYPSPSEAPPRRAAEEPTDATRNFTIHVAVPPDAPPRISVGVPTGTGGVSADTDATSTGVLGDALRALAEARRRPYYEREADERDRSAYYADIEHGLSPSDRFWALSQLVTDTHRVKLGYKPSVHLYPAVDLQENGQLRSIYSAKEYSPEEFIREDLRIEAARAVRLREVLTRESFDGGRSLEDELAILEAAMPYNCEHVVPQSWFDKRQPMRGDLHHLFACETNCNSFRSNIPYFDFADFEEAIREDCGKRDENRFEPTAGKGAVARATLYFLLRYPGEINSTRTEYERERVATLVDWHRANPVSRYELHRNAEIFAVQGNRNPLIDFPEWADRIAFDEGLG